MLVEVVNGYIEQQIIINNEPQVIKQKTSNICCGKCHAILLQNSGYRFLKEQGAKVNETFKFCPQCGEPVNFNTVFNSPEKPEVTIISVEKYPEPENNTDEKKDA